MLFVRKLRREERDFIYANLDDKTVGKRCLALALSYEGYEVREIARRINFHPDWVRKVIRKFNEQGIKSLLKKRGRKPKLSRKDERVLLKVAIKNPRSLVLLFLRGV